MQLIERHSGSQSCSHLLNELIAMNLFQTIHQISEVRNQDKSVCLHVLIVTACSHTFTDQGQVVFRFYRPGPVDVSRHWP